MLQGTSDHSRKPDGPRVAVVGPCASGKTTLVNNLLRAGIDAWAVGQEHSAVRQLWARRSPDLVVGLDVSLDVLRSRRSPVWPAAIYEAQHERLRDAYGHADLVLDTGIHSETEVLAAVLTLVDEFAARQPVN